MNLKQKIVIDKIIGIPAVVAAGWVTRLFSLFKKPNAQEIKKIVVCKFAGMGSIMQSTPLLQTLKINFPEAELTFVTTVGNKTLLENFPFVDRVVLVNDTGFKKLITSSFSLIKYLLKNKTDHYIDLEIHSYYSAIITSFSSGKRYGLSKKKGNLKDGIYSDVVFFDTRIPVAQVYLEFAKLMNCADVISELYSFEKKSRVIPGTKPYIVINPNASDLRLERRWDYKNYISLVESLHEFFPDHGIFLTGSANEREYVQLIHEKVSQKAIDTSGSLSIEELIRLIDHSDLVITNDTGPMHLSIALKKNTIALFGPCSPEQYTFPENTRVLYKKVSCSPCVHDFLISPCGGDNQCMKQTKTEEVFQACREMLKKITLPA